MFPRPGCKGRVGVRGKEESSGSSTATFQLLLPLDAAVWAERCWLSQSSVPLGAHAQGMQQNQWQCQRGFSSSVPGTGGDISLLRHVRSAFPYPGVLQAEHVLLINPS